MKDEDVKSIPTSTPGYESEKSSYQARKIDPYDIKVPTGYQVEVFARGLNVPINLIFDDNGDMILADSGVIDGNGKVLKLIDGNFKVIADGFNPPLTGINYYKGNIYVSHRGFITIIKPDGSKKNIISGLPSWGDHHNNQVIFGRDGKMYFGQGTATNSGVVGEDNSAWVTNYPFFHDYPGITVTLNGQNFATRNFLTNDGHDIANTGAYSPYSVPSSPYERVKGILEASGSILRANPDGSGLERIAWGLRNPFRLKFDAQGRLFAGNHGADVRGSRPIQNSQDEFRLIVKGMWYGWPDYFMGLPCTLPMFKAYGKPQPSFLLAQHPMNPPRPFTTFATHSAIMGFDFNYNANFGSYGDAYIAEFGSEAPETTGGEPAPFVGHRVSKINMTTGKVSPFAINKLPGSATYSGSGGFELPIDVIFDKAGVMYVVDFGLNKPGEVDEFIPNTGVIWKINKK